MLKLAYLSVMSSILVSCGSDPLVGLWYGDVTGYSCGMAFRLDGDSFYRDAFACELSGGGNGIAITEGIWERDDDSTIVVTTERSTCAGVTAVPKTTTVTVTQDGDGVTVTTNAGVVFLHRVTEEPEAHGTAAFGCFDASLYFTPHVLQEL